MGLDVVERDALSVKEPLQCSHLIDDNGSQLFGGELHLSSPETLKIRKPGMGANANVMGFAVSDSLHHDQRVTTVKSTSDVCDVNHGEKLEIRAAHPVPILQSIS
jgi:hypothetical protein